MYAESKTPTLKIHEAQAPIRPSIPLGERSHSKANPDSAESCHNDGPPLSNHNGDSSLQRATSPEKPSPKTMTINFSKEFYQSDQQPSARLPLDTKNEEKMYIGAVRLGYKKVKVIVITSETTSMQVFKVEDGDDSFINALYLMYNGLAENIHVSLVFSF